MERYVVPKALPMTVKAIGVVANQLLMKHSPGTLQGRSHFDAVRYLEFHLVKEHETDYRISDSLPHGTWAETRLKLVTLSEETYVEAYDGQGFGRFTIAHEIGHVLLHQDLMMKRFHSPNVQCQLFTRDELEAYCDPEWQANEFAGAVLMPTSGVTSLRQRFPEPDTFIYKVMDTFKVTYGAAKCRIERLIRRGKLSF